jgi:cytidyltransferase-like protein
MKYKHKIGVFLARMQPLHIAHLDIIQKALSECEKVYVCLGSANKVDMLRNPFTIDFRKQILLEALIERVGVAATRVDVFEIPDWSYENDINETIEWGRYFYYNVVSRIQSKRFAIYYNDDPTIIKGWFDSEVKDYITLELLDRSLYYGGLSATKIRDAIIKNNMEYVCKYCPMAVVTRMDIIRSYYIEVSQNPKPDFAME